MEKFKNSQNELWNLDENWCINFDRIDISDLISPRRKEILEWISEWIIWQENAKNVLADFIIQALTKIWKNKWTMWNLFFHWPTWVWKTEIVRSISEFLIWDPNAFIKVNCWEFAEQHTKTRLFWAPPSYVWYNNPPIFNSKDLNRPYLKAIENWKLNPILNNLSSFSIILFDEIEKAHYEVVQSLLWAMDQWIIKSINPSNNDVNLSNTIIIFTSNIWEHILDIKNEEKHMWFKIEENQNDINWELFLNDAIKNRFSPEFRWRIDSFVRFDKLNKNEVLEIIDLNKNRLQNDINNYYTNYPKINIIFTDELYNNIYDNFHDSSKWIRELERNFNLKLRRKVELLLTLSQFWEKYGNKKWLLNFEFSLDENNIILSIKEIWIQTKKEIANEIIVSTWNSVEKLLEIDFKIFREVENVNYINFSHTKDYPDLSLIEIHSKKFLVNEKEFNSIIDDIYNSYQTITGVKFEYLPKINLNVFSLRKLVNRINGNYLINWDLNISIDLYVYMNLVSIIKPICKNKNVNFEKVNEEILIYFATKWN